MAEIDSHAMSWKDVLLLEHSSNVNFTVPDVLKIREARKERNKALLQKLDYSFIGTCSTYDVREMAAIKIQKVYRGHLGRKEYINILYDNVLASELELDEQQERQVKEGEILIESYQIERELEDNELLNNNKSRLNNASASLIQRAWRNRHDELKKDHICCSCNDDYPDLYEYYNQTKTICFCCEYHRLNPELNQQSTFTTDSTYLSDSLRDWSHVDSTMLGEQNSDITSRISNSFDVQLTFVESYESDNSKPEVEIFTPYDKTDSFLNISIEKVTNEHKIKNPDALEPVVEASRVLKSLKIHEEYDRKKRKESVQSGRSLNIIDLKRKTFAELQQCVDALNSMISIKNSELLEELMIRDELHAHQEALLMDADDLMKENCESQGYNKAVHF